MTRQSAGPWAARWLADTRHALAVYLRSMAVSFAVLAPVIAVVVIACLARSHGA